MASSPSRPGRSSLTAASSTPRMSKSIISSPPADSPAPRPSYFPHRLTATLSALKMITGSLLVALGTAAMVQQAGYSRQATGIWGGIVTIISGVLGAYTVRTQAVRGSVVGFLASSVLSLVASVVVIIYSATGLARDSSQPFGLRRNEAGHLVTWEGGDSREAAMLINTLLIIMGVLDVIFSLPSLIISLRELCQCYNPALLEAPAAPLPRKDMMAWPSSSVFYSQASGIPYRPMPPLHPTYRNTSPPYLHSDLTSGGPRHRSKSPGPPRLYRPPSIAYPSYPPMDLYNFYPMHPPTPSMMGGPPHYFAPPGAWLYPGPPDWEQQQHMEDQQRLYRQERRRQKERGKRSRSKSQGKEGRGENSHRKRQKGPTDSDIERSYTGMDRDMAEEFIEQTMDPSQLIDQTMSGTESEAW